MNTLKNRVQLIGNVGQDPEIKNLEGGKKLANISLATNDSYTNEKGEKITDTQWHRLTAWGNTAEIIEKYVTKGKEIAITGKISYKSYDDKNGEKRFTTEITINELQFVGKA
ncbi:MAG: single-stranded DNA-binding protein [Flavobacterium sp.]|nr:single-stranded DNA-binding protein [Flavobacterium sp.]